MGKKILVDKESKGKMYVERYCLKPEQSELFNAENDLFYYIIQGTALWMLRHMVIMLSREQEYLFLKIQSLNLLIQVMSV